MLPYSQRFVHYSQPSFSSQDYASIPRHHSGANMHGRVPGHLSAASVHPWLTQEQRASAQSSASRDDRLQSASPAEAVSPKVCGVRIQVWAYVVLAVVAFQYLFSASSVAFLSQVPPEAQEPLPFAHGYDDKSVSLVTIMLGTGASILSFRIILIGFVAFDERAMRRTVLREYGMTHHRTPLLQLANNVSIRLCFTGVCGAPVYFIESMYLRNSWNHPQRFTIACLLTVYAAMEISLSGMLLLSCDTRIAQLDGYEENWHATLKHRPSVRRPEVEELVCQAKSNDTASENKEETLGELKTLHLGEEEVVCSICLMPLDVGDIAGRLSCKHVFHKSCISTWLDAGHGCPMRCEPGQKLEEHAPAPWPENQNLAGNGEHPQDQEMRVEDLHAEDAGQV
mmetsp:Transcript_60103/g.143223  ORF Transcript_60103/g.143223 Transcript_60103/m.143223 type:complete len:396 (-) Transcript_60103:140-1327(-)